jgi:hypothetical protein
MTNLIMNRFGVLLTLCAMLFIVSCDKDDPVIDPGTGLNLSDGLYLQLEGNDPVSTAGLNAEVVEANDFKSQERTGFTAGYMWLDAGNYTLVEVSNKEITGTTGGTVASVDDTGSDCDFNTYQVVTTAANGPAFNVATSGLYKVTNDQQRGEMVMYQTSEASIIGSATPNGWAGDTPLTGSVSSDGGEWKAEGVILRSGEWKIRFNCRWGINRRIDPNGSLDDASNGYQVFTNFGGTASSLVVGGANIQQTEDGEYTVTATWDPRDGWSVAADRTGDAPTITFNPNDYKMAVIGDATNAEDLDGDGTPDGWQSDRNLFHKEEGGVNTWVGVVTFGDAGGWKFRANDAWDINYGGDINMNLTLGGDNFTSPGAGAHYVTISTADEGETWTATTTPMGWGLIGEGSPAMSWDDGTDVTLEAQGNVGGVSTYTATGDFTTSGWKFRAAGQWAHNIGGDLTFLTTDGDNIELGAAGNYTVTLSFNGEVYSATVE